MANNRYTYIFEEFTRMFPIDAKEVDNWDILGEKEIIVKLKDGTVRTYDYIERSSMYAESEEALRKKRHPTTEEEWQTLFAIRLRRKINMKGYTQEGFSWATGISQSAISKYTDGLVTPSAWTIVKMAQVLGCSESALIHFE